MYIDNEYLIKFSYLIMFWLIFMSGEKEYFFLNE